jgi:AraC-like DNA-binding protein
LLAEKNYFDEILCQGDQKWDGSTMDIFSSFPVFHLDETKTASFFQSLDNIRRSIQLPHLYKGEIIKYQIHILQLMLAELISGNGVDTHDLKHKDNILKIFLHLASRNFKKERQIQFYADRMNMTSTYLSRVVKELTGHTVFSYLSHFLYNEICIQLKTTEKTISEIADELNFNDQSALTNFFRTKAGMSPLSYRKKHL